MLTEAEVNTQFDEILKQDISGTEKALRLFLFISKNQIFWDGNKRTALIAANSIMFNHGAGLVSIPENKFMSFNELLSNYYNSSEDVGLEDILYFMYSDCIFGINFDPMN